MLNKPFQSPSTASFFNNLTVSRLQGLLRRGELGLVALAVMIGIAAGLLVSLVSFLSEALHYLVFGVEGTLSGSGITGPIVLAGPIIGGIALGIIVFILSRTRKKPMVDPIEANALHGGRLSLTDSIIVCVQNIVSNGFGASVGLEAGYTQIASGFASKLGVKLKMRRGDLRLLVGCGASGAIAAAFDAPLTGAFYAVELIIGSYTVVTLAPVIVSALVAKIVTSQIGGHGLSIDIGAVGDITPVDYLPAIMLGVLCAGVGIVLMQAVSFVEETARKSAVSQPIRPMIGGIVIGLLALVSPQILAGGHGALHINLNSETTIYSLVLLFVLKSAASAVSIGSGFRGGLFFASLFMGALLGKIFAFAAMLVPGLTLTPVIYAVVGMSAFAAAVIGGPLTMTFLALELTGDFPITALVLASVITTSLVVRVFFGYSFATWRFHLRGETIRSAQDVGWIRDLTVAKMMRADVRTAKLSMGLEEFCKQFPLGSTQRVIMVNDDGRYAGIVLLAEIYADPMDRNSEGRNLESYLHYTKDVLLPTMNVKQAAALFDATQSEALAVMNDRIQNRPIGLLTESHTLRRYSEELDLRRREASGEF
ncbi:chloride channel protein [Allorhizobium taibaishanense]|uniref:Chloride channel protein n=1 Tax=Allorhizobium taibaishanense TaxID=887144 RepID=A0A1Q9A191_9HYPH|nr:chloride channel protein [Allorhizobium taibaishanense]MBB4007976.1 CIC family chloride channel protein [Allorhizobium taibaishanense]OLP48289.1 chloride channel protein [Allorhizobium taibaishanense]